MGVQLAIEDCIRLGKYDSKQPPILVTCPSIWDGRLCLSKSTESNLHERKKILVLPELSAADKEKEKKLLKKRFEMISGCIEQKFKIHNLKLLYDNQEVALDWLQFSINTINVWGIASAKKRIQLTIFLSKLCHRVVCLTETWLDSDFDSKRTFDTN